MDIRIELNHTHYNGNGGWKNTDGVIYEINNDGITASAGGNEITSPDITIANEVVIDGNVYPVTTFSGMAFYKSEILKTLYLPTNIKKIKSQVCQECNLESVTIHGGVKEFSQYPFYDAKIKSLKLNGCQVGGFPNSAKIETMFFDSVETLFNVKRNGGVEYIYISGTLLEDLVIPEGITEIPGYLVAGCKSLKTVVLPSTIKTIGNSAFNDCTNLRSINLPEGLEKIESYAFEGCSSLDKIELPKSLSLIFNRTFSKTSIEQIVIPQGCKLGSSVFDNCVNLKSVQLPEDLTVIYDKLFYNCLSLTSIDIPSTVTKIHKQAFYGCNLTEIHLPEQLEYIGEEAMAFLPITDIVIPASVVEIDNYIFEGCGKLSRVCSKIADPGKCDVKTFELSAKYKRDVRWSGDVITRTVGTEVFYKQATLVVPNIKGMVTAYKKKAAWKKFSSIVMDNE